MKIANSHFVITGGSRGIGYAVAEMAAKQGANIYIASRSIKDGAQEELTKLGAASVRFLPVDLSSKQGVEDLVTELSKIDVDILFNNAGQLTGGLLEKQSLDDIYNMFQVNIQAVVHLSRAVVPMMVKKGRGKIINNSSVSAFMHFPCATTYAASKAAVSAFTNCLDVELSGTGVSTLCLITPGVKTEMFDDIEKKYGANFEVPTQSITPQQYAQKIKNAILNDDKHFWPQGSTRIGLWVARFMNPLFRSVVKSKFSRKERVA